MFNFLRNQISRFKTNSGVSNSFVTSLAPKILTDEKELVRVKPYLDALKSAIDDPGISNIAITGGYGSGKSTIIRTFQNQYPKPQYHYLNISLASFNDAKIGTDSDKSSTSTPFERQLEVSILQQIFYHVKPSEIPDSRFKRIINVTWIRILVFSLGLVFWVASVIILFKFDYIIKFDPTHWDSSLPVDWVSVTVFAVFFAGIGLFAKTAMRLFSNSKINKFNIKGELELGDSLDKSVFNEHLEEILYFFERTKYNVVVIEDLDRFESTNIFTKLREINILLNNSNPIGRRINFVYAIKDEMFVDKNERVKFFEYIIPIIPFINPSNAGDQLAKIISEANLQDVLSKDFTEDVVTFIDDIDMRLLINIFHEYQIYKQNLSSDLNQDELFAIVTYKNLFPDDFGELHQRKGKLFQFINNRHNYVDNFLKSNNAKIQELKNRIKDVEEANILNETELRRLYVSGYFSLIPNASNIVIDGAKKSFDELIEEENFKKLINNSRVKYIYYNSFRSEGAEDISFSEVEEVINNYYTYEERISFLSEGATKKINACKNEIQELLDEQARLETLSLKQIFEMVDIEPYLKEFDNNPLIRNLVLNGYINENYNNYISLFHEVNLKSEDYAFERKVKSGQSSNFDYTLYRLENLVKKIPLKYFEREAILNFQLFDFLAEHYSFYSEKYDRFIKILYSNKQKSLEFIDGYFARNSVYVPKMFKELTGKWPQFWEELLKRAYPVEKLNKYLVAIMYYAELQSILNFSNVHDFVSHIEKQPNFLDLVSENENRVKIKQLLIELNVKLKNIKRTGVTPQELFDHIYANNLYEINPSNLGLFLMHENAAITVEQLHTANYSTLVSSGCDKAINYVNDNINNYAKDVLLKLPENSAEDEVSLVLLLNNKFLQASYKQKIISTQQKPLSTIDNIQEQEDRIMLLSNNKVASNWANIFSYCDGLEDQQFDDTLINYLEIPENYTELSTKRLEPDETFNLSYIKDFEIKLLTCDRLSINAYSQLVKSSYHRWGELSFGHLQADKMRELVTQKIITLTKANFDKLTEYFRSSFHHITLIENNQHYFIKEIKSFMLEQDDVLKLITSEVITKQTKVELIKNTEDEYFTENSRIAAETCVIMAETEPISISFSVLESIVRNAPKQEHCIRVICKQAGSLTNPELTTLVQKLGGDYRDLFRKKCKPTFNKNDYNEQLLTILKSRKMINSFSVDSKKSNLLRAIALYQ
ncbi:MAG: hypothetical protein ACO1PI_12725 [Bacteroidota bacterium]